MKYSIPECNFENLEKKLTRIRNKCAKYGCEFKFERLGEHIEEKKFTDWNDVLWEVNGQRVYRTWTELVKYIDIDVEGTAVVNGWQFVASLEYTEKGNIISGIGEIEIPDRYYSCAPWCEHCKTARDRKYSYIVYNKEAGEFKQVGKACLKDFTGGLSAEMAALVESYIKECEEASEFSGLGGWSKTYFNVKDFMAYVAETIRVFGYFKRDGFNVSTADRAEELYRYGNRMRISEMALGRVREAEGRGFDVKNQESVELANSVREWILASEKDDNYFHNLKVACGLEYGDYKVIGLLASAFPTYNRELEYEAERKAREAAEAQERAKSTWMGDVGKKVSFVVADCRAVTSWETQWGTVTVYKFTDENGLVATWKTSKWIPEDRAVGRVLSGTVKEQKEYRGVKQTELTRCKLGEKVEEKKEWNPEAQKAFEDAMKYFEEGA